MYSNRITRPGGAPYWQGRFTVLRSASDAARNTCKRYGAPCTVETWWGRDVDGAFNGKTHINTREAAGDAR